MNASIASNVASGTTAPDHSHWGILKRLIAFMKPLNNVMALSIFARTMKLLFKIALIAFAAGAIGRYLQTPTSDTVWFIVGMLVMYAFFLGLFNYIETFTGHYVAFSLLAMLRNEFYDKMEPLAPAGTATLRTGDAVSRVINDCERVEPFYAHTIAPAITAFVVPAIVLAMLYQYAPIFMWTLLPFVIVMVVILPILTAVIGHDGGDEWRTTQGEVNAFLTDSLQGLRDTIAFGFGDARARTAWKLGEKLQRGQDFLVRADSVQRAITEFVFCAAPLAMMYVGWDLVQQGVLDPLREIPVIVAITLTVFYAATGLNNVVNDYKVSIVSARRLFELMDQRPLVNDSVTHSPIVHQPAISFNHVRFGYGEADVLKDISFDIPAGSHIAIVGSSGAGKSTIANLLLRFWDPKRGSVTIGGHALTEFKMDDLRELIAVVSQRNYIFNTTIGDNIRLGKSDATQAEIEKAAERANLTTWIASLPDGYDTRVGEMGANISGGQRQRLAIARAILKDAPILILDEATSSLDVETERDVNAAIRELEKGRTVITIAHRLSTVKNAHEIIVLEQGQVAERGTHEDLLARNGVYARLFELQADEVDAVVEEEDHSACSHHGHSHSH
jgi:ATP-binding cassette subfamily C protein CydC